MPIAIAIRWLERRSPRLVQPHRRPIGSAAVPDRRPCARILEKRVSSSKKNYAKGIFLCHLICWARLDGYVTCVERKRTRSFATVDVTIAEIAATGSARGKLFLITVAIAVVSTLRYRVSRLCFRRSHYSSGCVHFVDSASKPRPASPTSLCQVKRN
jgi:hypothetical protein